MRKYLDALAEDIPQMLFAGLIVLAFVLFGLM